MLLISFTIVNIGFVPFGRRRKHITNAAYVNLTGGLFVGTTTKLQSFSINSSSFSSLKRNTSEFSICMFRRKGSTAEKLLHKETDE